MNDKNLDLVLADAMMLAMEGKDPSGAIEMQEARGQRELVRHQRLPIMVNQTCNDVPDYIKNKGVKFTMDVYDRLDIINKNLKEYTKSQYEKMGIKILSELDELFYNAVLPAGWEIKATDHHMWNKLYDDNGRERASIFYKAAFYDRHSFINFNTRFSTIVTHVDEHDWETSDYVGYVKDSGKIVYQTKTVANPGKDWDARSKIEKVLSKELSCWMDLHYPNYKDINAYWD